MSHIAAVYLLCCCLELAFQYPREHTNSIQLNGNIELSCIFHPLYIQAGKVGPKYVRGELSQNVITFCGEFDMYLHFYLQVHSCDP